MLYLMQMKKHLAILLGLCLLLLAGCTGIQRKLLFYPTHHSGDNGLSVWRAEGKFMGYCREVPRPRNIWLMLHGNGGQAADRAYALASFSGRDSVFILEYPGYGAREGKPSIVAFDAAATEACRLLQKTFPKTAICVMGESIGSGPACLLATLSPPPEKIVLVVPFDRLTSVGADHAGSVASVILSGKNWDNVSALSKYKGPVEIFGAQGDEVIPVKHARNLADSIPGAKFHSIPGGHNDWSNQGCVEIRNP